MAGWHHQLDGHEYEWTPGVGDGQGGLACCDSWGHKESDMTERLNWTELNWFSALGFSQNFETTGKKVLLIFYFSHQWGSSCTLKKNQLFLGELLSRILCLQRIFPGCSWLSTALSTTDSVLSLEIFLKSPSLSVKIYSAVYYRFLKPPGCAFTHITTALIPLFLQQMHQFSILLDTTMPIPINFWCFYDHAFHWRSVVLYFPLTNLILEWRIKDFKGHKQKNYKLRQNTFSLYYTQLVHLFSI